MHCYASTHKVHSVDTLHSDAVAFLRIQAHSDAFTHTRIRGECRPPKGLAQLQDACMLTRVCILTNRNALARIHTHSFRIWTHSYAIWHILPFFACRCGKPPSISTSCKRAEESKGQNGPNAHDRQAGVPGRPAELHAVPPFTRHPRGHGWPEDLCCGWHSRHLGHIQGAWWLHGALLHSNAFIRIHTHPYASIRTLYLNHQPKSLVEGSSPSPCVAHVPNREIRIYAHECIIVRMH